MENHQGHEAQSIFAAFVLFAVTLVRNPCSTGAGILLMDMGPLDTYAVARRIVDGQFGMSPRHPLPCRKRNLPTGWLSIAA